MHSKFCSLFAVLLALLAQQACADRILVLVDTLNTRDTHSMFWKMLTGLFMFRLLIIHVIRSWT